MERFPHVVTIQVGNTTSKYAALLPNYYTDTTLASRTGISKMADNASEQLQGDLNLSDAASKGLIAKIYCSVNFGTKEAPVMKNRVLYASVSKLPGLLASLKGLKIKPDADGDEGTIVGARIRRRRVYR